MPVNEAQVRDILRVFCRMPIPKGQLGLYRISIDASEVGFTSIQVCELMNLRKAQQRGMLAALSLRINGTPRETSPNTKPGLSLLFDQEWDGHMNTYKPHPELKEAIRRLPRLNALLQNAMEVVLATDDLHIPLPDGIPPDFVAPTDFTPELPGPDFMKSPFEAMLDAFEKCDLVFSPELIANLLLALQVKRFIILTGISGTGKTRLAQVLAERLRVHRETLMPADPGDQGALLTVMPYMLKHHRMILPQQLAIQMPVLLTDQGSRLVKVKWPGGTIDLSAYVLGATQILFRGAMREWFDRTFSLGSSFQVQVEGPDGALDTLVFDNPSQVSGPPKIIPNTEVVAVRPDWTDHRGLLGSYNPLTQQYMMTPFLHLLLTADQEFKQAETENRPAAPFFLILDEMNLARVEHYFADFLSALESGASLHLHDSIGLEDGTGSVDRVIPRQQRIPPNLFFIGTVNVDESTYMFSPKVLDRAFTLELNAVDLSGLGSGIERGSDLDLDSWTGFLEPPAKPSREDWQWFIHYEDGAMHAEVTGFHHLLSQHNRHFGYRVATELARFVRLAVEQASEPDSAAWAALDLAILQKVLVKLHGTRHELGTILQSLLGFSLVGTNGGGAGANLADWHYVPAESVVRRLDENAEIEALFPRSAAKLWRMKDRLEETGFTSWIE